jgi:cation diffusion facilitator family transporter
VNALGPPDHHHGDQPAALRRFGEPDRGHDHPHGHEHAREHDLPSGIRGWLHQVFVPHSHDAADSIDDALQASSQGIRTVKISLVVLGITAVAQLVIVGISGSVALLADTIHNFSDALTAVPLWIAFALGRRKATRRYTHGYGRAEDLAGLFIVAMIALSAVGAGVESIRRLAEPQPLDNLWWVLVAGLIGFAGNEAVAVYRIRTGRCIGSAALVADGLHARTDGFTSLVVVLGVIGVWAGFPQADPFVGLVITAAILILLWGTARDVGRRLLDGVDPDLVDRAEHTLRLIDGVHDVTDLRLRWSGHRLNLQAALATSPTTTVADVDTLTARAGHHLRRRLPNLGDVDLTVTSCGPTRTAS